jgi:hypothetical protein
MRTFSLLVIISTLAISSFAHCDRLDGPVVAAARLALQKGDVAPVLAWVTPENEAAIRAAFRSTLAVRAKGEDARALADRYFFETVVRLHRAGEGAPYTGLQEGGEMPHALAEADRALQSGSVDALTRKLTDEATAGIRKRFAEAAAARKHAGENVEAGRRFVAAYVEYLHYVERLWAGAATRAHDAQHEH